MKALIGQFESSSQFRRPIGHIQIIVSDLLNLWKKTVIPSEATWVYKKKHSCIGRYFRHLLFIAKVFQIKPCPSCTNSECLLIPSSPHQLCTGVLQSYLSQQRMKTAHPTSEPSHQHGGSATDACWASPRNPKQPSISSEQNNAF